jgi:hypothetical protein
LQLSHATWVDLVENFGRWYRRVAGRTDSLAEEAKRRGQHWMQGISHSRVVCA